MICFKFSYSPRFSLIYLLIYFSVILWSIQFFQNWQISIPFMRSFVRNVKIISLNLFSKMHLNPKKNRNRIVWWYCQCYRIISIYCYDSNHFWEWYQVKFWISAQEYKSYTKKGGDHFQRCVTEIYEEILSNERSIFCETCWFC